MKNQGETGLDIKQVNAKFMELRRKFEPVGASKRLIFSRDHKNEIEKISLTARFLKRNYSPSKEQNVSNDCDLRYKEYLRNCNRKIMLTPNIVESRRTEAAISGRQSDSILPKLSLARLRDINNIVDSCNDLTRINKSEGKIIKMFDKTSQNSYREANDMLEALKLLSPGNIVSDCLNLKKQIEKTEAQVLAIPSGISKSSPKLIPLKSLKQKVKRRFKLCNL